MVIWSFYNADQDLQGWEGALGFFHDSSIYSTHNWGLCKQREGWTSVRCIGREVDDVRPKTLLQVLVRRYPLSVCVVWIPGGAHGEIGLLDDVFCQKLKKFMGAKAIYFRFRGERVENSVDCSVLARFGWRRVRSKLSSGLSIVVDLMRPEETMMNELSGNWRHNLKRSFKRNITIEHWTNPDPKQIWDLYCAMQDHKGLNGLHDSEKIKNIVDTLHGNMVFYRAMNEGQCISMRACVFVGKRALDFLAATNVVGRSTYASYGVLWKILLHCKAMGIETYDLNGVDPDGNKGVFNFKLGTGGQSIRYLGEWERASPKWLSLLINWKISKASL